VKKLIRSNHVYEDEIDDVRDELLLAISNMRTKTVSGIWHGTEGASAAEYVQKQLDMLENAYSNLLEGNTKSKIWSNGLRSYVENNIVNSNIWRDDLSSEKQMKSAFGKLVRCLRDTLEPKYK